MIVVDLHDVFAQVGFNDVDAFGLQRLVHIDFFGRHALAFDAALEVVALANVDDVAVGFGGVGSPQHVSPGGGDVGFHLFQQIGQIVQRPQPRAASLLAQCLRVRQFAHHYAPPTVGVARAPVERGFQLNIIQRDHGCFVKLIGFKFHRICPL